MRASHLAIRSRRAAAKLAGAWAIGLAMNGLALFVWEAKSADPSDSPTATTETVAAGATAEAKPNDDKPVETPAAASQSSLPAGLGERSDKQVGEGDQLGFRQSKVASEMRELEDRMFRLADSLQAQEPENSSRLRLGLKFSRDELIHHQMLELQQALAKLELSEASIEQKQLLSKLQRLQEMLLSPDLDLQMKLERLRQIREALRRLEGAIKEEEREQAMSAQAKSQQQSLALVKRRRGDLAALIRRQSEHVTAGGRLARAAGSTDGSTPGETADAPQPPEAPPESPRDAGALSAAQRATRGDAQSLAEERVGAAEAEHVVDAITAMDGAVAALDKPDAPAALPLLEQSLRSLQAEDERLAALAMDLEKDLARERFQSMQRDQAGNRQTTDGISDLVRMLGEQGAGALNELVRASGSMSSAEGQLNQLNAAGADDDQTSAAAALKYARNLLDEEAGKLLNALRSEIKKRVLEDLAMMLERQIAVRESTVVLGPRVVEGSRQATSAVVALAGREGQLVQTAGDLVALVEETEFGIALPAALGLIRDAMVDVQTALAAADASESVINAERQIEDDLKSLMDAMKQMPGSGPPGQGGRGAAGDRQRELNRIVAELKTIRMLQTRVHRDTTSADAERGEESASAALRRQVERLQGRQEDIRDVTDRLNAERGDELSQQ